jgi:hypothetical protein
MELRYEPSGARSTGPSVPRPVQGQPWDGAVRVKRGAVLRGRQGGAGRTGGSELWGSWAGEPVHAAGQRPLSRVTCFVHEAPRQHQHAVPVGGHVDS